VEVKALDWYVDAWAVHDGKVFASRREPHDPYSERSTIESADTTVFMAVPDLQAVPVGRISTALRATRSGFQDGFRTSDGDEIPFTSLAQIREVVRRAFLIAAIGPDGPGAIGAPAPAQPPDFDGAGGRLLDEMFRDGSRFAVGLDEVEGASRNAKAFHLTVENPDALRAAVGYLALATLLEFEPYLQRDDSRAHSWFIGWAAVLLASGAVEGLHPGASFGQLLERLNDRASRFGASTVLYELHSVSVATPEGWSVYDVRSDALWTRASLAAVPLPRGAFWDRRLRRLSEMHILPLADRTFWDQQRFVFSLAPMVLYEVVRPLPSVVAEMTASSTPVERALDSLQSALVFAEVPEEAEAALKVFADACLNGESGRSARAREAVAHA
jgi:hypothetical protein